jgi:alpha-galactosidase
MRLMGKKITCYFVLFLLGSSLSWVLKVAFAGSIAPLLQGYEEGSYGYSRSFNNVFSTSNYGIFQLNNGLARTPQMGSLSNAFFLHFFFIVFWELDFIGYLVFWGCTGLGFCL